MIVIGIFLAAEPRIYDRGIAWMLPLRHRASFYRIAEHVGFTLRRLLFGRLVGMIFEGVFTWIMLMLGGVPMAALLGLVTGVLAFIPNIGAIMSGVLMVAVGFSAGAAPGPVGDLRLFLRPEHRRLSGRPVHRPADGRPGAGGGARDAAADGRVVRDLGVLFADPILATLKVALVDLSRRQASAKARRPRSGRREASSLRLRRLLLLRRACCISAAPRGTTFTHVDVEVQVARWAGSGCPAADSSPKAELAAACGCGSGRPPASASAPRRSRGRPGHGDTAAGRRALAAVEHRAVVEPAVIVDERRRRSADRRRRCPALTVRNWRPLVGDFGRGASRRRSRRGRCRRR